MHDPKEVLEICEKATEGPWYGLEDAGVFADPEYKKPIFETGCGCCTRSDLKTEDADFIALARTALPEFAERIIELEEINESIRNWNACEEYLHKNLLAENAKLRAVAECGKTFLRHCLPEPDEDEEHVVCDGYPDACPHCDAGKLREALIALAAGYGGEG
jgi:hypothetical protein